MDSRLRGNDATLARLMIWLSPAYPVGGYCYSHGLEWAVEAGKVGDAATLGAWIEDVLAHGAWRSDAIFLAEAWRAFAASDTGALEQVAELAAAFAPSAERRLETLAQGTAFLAATLAAWPKPELEALAADGRDIAYPVAVGACTAGAGVWAVPARRPVADVTTRGSASAAVPAARNPRLVIPVIEPEVLPEVECLLTKPPP